MRRQQRVQKLIVRGARAGEHKRFTSHTARDAARRAVSLASKGYLVAVTAEPGNQMKMACVPKSRGTDRLNAARCYADGLFKKQVKGLAGMRARR